MESNIKLERGEIIVDSVTALENQKEGSLTAQIREQVHYVYPSIKIVTSLSQNPFGLCDFTEQEGKRYPDMRVTWFVVPIGSTVESVQQKLDEYEDACIYKIKSNHPILSDEQKIVINDPEMDLTIDDIAERQICRYGEGHEKEGQLILDKHGKVQYRTNALFLKNKEDEDLRTEDPSDFYAPSYILDEINEIDHVVEGQNK